MTDSDIVLDFMVVKKKIVEGKTVVLVEKLFLERCEPLHILFLSFKQIRCSGEVDAGGFDIIAVEVHDSLVKMIGVLFYEDTELSF